MVITWIGIRDGSFEIEIWGWGLRFDIKIKICHSQIKLCIMRIGIRAWNFYLEIELWDLDKDRAMVTRNLNRG